MVADSALLPARAIHYLGARVPFRSVLSRHDRHRRSKVSAYDPLLVTTAQGLRALHSRSTCSPHETET